MATLTRINNMYTGETAYFNVLNYIANSVFFLGGVVPQLAAAQMQAVETEYNDDPNANVLHRLVFKFRKSDRMNEKVIGMLCNRIASFYAKYQAVFAIEKVKNGIQLHVVINAFSFADGEVLHIDETGLQKLILFCVPFLPRCTIK